MILGGFAVALMIRPPATREALGGLKRIAGLLFMGALLFLSVYLTLHYLHTSGGSLSLEQTTTNNSGTGVGFGSSNISYSSSPSYYWHDVYTVLFDPLPINAHGASQLIAALENTLIGVLIPISWRNLRMLVRAAFARPYLMMSLIYSILFLYFFAALGNLGLITRERSLLFPFFLVLLCIPRTPRGQPAAYDWEYKRKARKYRRLRGPQGLRPTPPVASSPVPAMAATAPAPAPTAGTTGRPVPGPAPSPDAGDRAPEVPPSG